LGGGIGRDSGQVAGLIGGDGRSSVFAVIGITFLISGIGTDTTARLIASGLPLREGKTFGIVHIPFGGIE
jgi:hypothetical protein